MQWPRSFLIDFAGEKVSCWIYH